VQKTKISFPNGGVIEAFPNNPDTIRGNTFHRIWCDEVNLGLITKTYATRIIHAGHD